MAYFFANRVVTYKRTIFISIYLYKSTIFKCNFKIEPFKIFERIILK